MNKKISLRTVGLLAIGAGLSFLPFKVIGPFFLVAGGAALLNKKKKLHKGKIK